MSPSLQTTIRSLSQRRGRERRGLALAEGIRLVEEALASGIPIRGAAVGPALEATERGQALKGELTRLGIPTEKLTARELGELADTEQPQGIIAVVEPRRWSWSDLALGARGVVAVLDGVQDPGNVGTILRTAFSLGAVGVVALEGTAELTNPKVMRGSMGAAFKLPAIAASRSEFLEWAREQGLALWVTDAAGKQPPAGRTRPVALILGNEGAGVTPELRAAAEALVAVPLAPGAESLNVAVAAGILLHEVTRAG